MDNAKDSFSESRQTRAYAAYYGFWVGLCWVASFALFILGLKQPLFSNFALLVGICSVPLCVWLMRGFREMIAPLSLRRAWYMAWMTMIGAALLCTAAQYIYFAFLDDGFLVRSYSEMLQQPEMHDMLQKMFPGQDLDTMTSQALTTFSTTPPAQIAAQFLFWNVLLASVLAFPTALFSFTRPTANDHTTK